MLKNVQNQFSLLVLSFCFLFVVPFTHGAQGSFDDEKSIDYCYKVNLIGDTSVGKTCIYTRLEKGTYSEQNCVISRVTSICYNVKLADKNIALNIFLTPGQERYAPLTKNAYRDVNCLILCYDLTHKKSYESCKERWKDEIEDFVQGKPLLILCGTKSDLVDKRKITPEDITKLENCFKQSDLVKDVLSIEVSAKDNRNIEKLMKYAAFYLVSYESNTYKNPSKAGAINLVEKLNSGDNKNNNPSGGKGCYT